MSDGRVVVEAEVEPYARGAPVAEPRRQGDSLSTEIVREYMEESRRNTTEVLELRNDVSGLRQELHSFREDMTGLRDSLNGLTKAIRGGNGEDGVLTTARLAERRLDRIEMDLRTVLASGTGPSQQGLRLVEQRQSEVIRRVESLERVQRLAINRWIAVAGVVIAAAAALLSWFHK